MRNHVKQMLLAGVPVLAVLLIAGVPLGRAVPYAVTLACPLVMVAMMWMMGRGATASGKNRPPGSGAMITAETADDTRPVRDDSAVLPLSVTRFT